MQTTRGALFSFLLLASVGLARADDAADALLQKMAQSYAALHSYADTASARFTNPDGNAGAQVDYHIWFQRPELFRIDAVTRNGAAKPTREVLWADGEDVRTWSSVSPVTTRKKVQLAGSKMFGTYAYHIPTLLKESYGGPQRLNQLEATAVLAPETVDGVECEHVRGHWQSDPYEVWIGKEDHLVRKIVANYSGYRMEELHRAITVDQPLAKKVFEFAPEEEVAGPMKKGTPPPRLPGEHRRSGEGN